MKIKDSNLIDLVKDVHISEYGIYYFFDGFIISEINQDVVYTWEAAQDIIEAAYEYYGDTPSICYITNRVNEYSIKPTDWIKFFKSKNKLNGYAIVSYTEKGWINALLEKLFLNTKVERFTNIYDAVNWTKNINSIAESEESTTIKKP